MNNTPRALTIKSGQTIVVNFRTDPANDWFLTIPVVEIADNDELVADNFLLMRRSQKNFFVKLIKMLNIGADGSESPYWLPRIFEFGNGYKCGDVVIQFRKNPHTKRWCVDVEKEYASRTPDILEKVTRITRSSLDNVKQAVKKTVKETGLNWLNTQRIGGDKVATHCVDAGWSPQKANAEQVMDVFEFVANSPDSPGKVALLEALQHMPTPIAKQIAMNIIVPPTANGNGG